MDLINEFTEENWKKLLKEHFTALKIQIKDLHWNYFHSNNKKKYSYRCNYAGSVDDAFTALYQQMNDLENDFFNKIHNNLISQQTWQQFGQLLVRTFQKIQMYFAKIDTDNWDFSNDFIENITKVLAKREKQFKRLFRSSTLSTYDSLILQYEASLQQRAKEFNLSINAQQSFSTIKVKCLNTFDLYIRQCVRLHSTMRVNGMCENLHDLIKRIFGQEISVDQNQRKSFELALKHIDIPLVNPQISCCEESYSRQNQYKDVFLSQGDIADSSKNSNKHVSFVDLIQSIRNERWVVLLGSAGSGKTTFVRWLMFKFAQALFIEKEHVIIHDIDMGPPRIPILIRIGEFTQWLERYPTSTLFDYIGQHTWLGQTYICDEFEILKDFIRHGHALIILDGLDEIVTLEMHGRIIALVRTFMQSHCMSHEFVSPFDDDRLANVELTSDFRCEGLLGKNLIIITSRVINYKAQPLDSKLISHYLIQPMDIDYICSFIQNWCSYVRDEIIDLLIQNIPDIKKNKVKNQSWLIAKIFISKIKSDAGLQSLASNLSVLSILCLLFAQYGIDALEKTRVQLYQQVIELMLQGWQNRQLNISKDGLMSLLSDIAFYVHSRSGSGLIDENDLIHLCRLSLQQWDSKKTSSMYCSRIEIRHQVNQFVQLLSEEAGIVAARSLCIYGFLHLTFQEYFVCLGLVDVAHSTSVMNAKDLVAARFLSLYSNPRLREPLNLAIGWISFSWSFEDYDYFCTQLQSKTNISNRCMPVGSLFFVSALNDLASLPSVSTVHNILDTLLYVDVHDAACIFKTELLYALDRLPIEMTVSWFDLLFSKENLRIPLKMLYILYEDLVDKRTLPKWIRPIFCETLWKQFGLLNEEIDIYIDRILMIVSVINNDCLPAPSGSLRAYLLSRPILIQEIHSSILTAFIALYGGLNYSKTKRKTSVIFTAQCMHRDSPLSFLFIEYMNDTTTDRVVRIHHLIEQCHKIVITAISTNITLQAIHSLVVLFCFYGIDASSSFRQYMESKVWQPAVRHMKIVLLYLREFFCIDPRSNFKINLTDIFEQFLTDSEENVIDFAQAVSHAYSQLLCANKSFLVPGFEWSNEGLYLINIRMPQTIDLSNITDWDDDKLVKRLPFVCCINTFHSRIETEELEAGDMELLKEGKHPFQLLQNKPTILLLAYLPTSVQNLYIQLFRQIQISSDDTSPLPYLHFLVEFLCIILTKRPCSIRFHVLLTILSATIEQHKMETFIPILYSGQIHSDNFSRIYEQSCFQDFTRIMRVVESYENACQAGELDILEEQRRMTNAENDLQLYAASCCLAKLVQKSCECNREAFELKFNELWVAIQAIKQPLWRVSAVINIFCISLSTDSTYGTHQSMIDAMKDPLLCLIAWLEELEPTTPLLIYVALIARCMSFIPEGFMPENRLIYNILQRMQVATMVEQLVICEALISLPCFRHDICQHICQSQYFENTVVLSQLAYNTNTIISKYLSTKYFAPSNITKIQYPTLLMSMHLSQLISHINVLNDFFSKKTDQHTADRLSSHSLVEKCLKMLETKPIKSLTVEAATTISAVLSKTSGTEIEEFQVFRIEQALLTKTDICKSACLVVHEWLNYQYDKLFCSFAYQGALLLASFNMWTPTVVRICCELLASENDHLRDRSINVIRDRKWCIEKQSINIVINCLCHWNKQQTKCLFQAQRLFCTLEIQMIDEIDQIMQVERERFQKTIENKSVTSDKTMNSYYTVSFFRLIKSLSPEVTDHIVTIMKSLLSSLSHSIDLLFLQWLFEHIPYELLKSNERFAEFLIAIVLNYPHVKSKVMVARNLIFFRDNEQVRSILWEIISNNEEENSDELVAACIWSLYIKQNDERLTDTELKTLDYLRQDKNSLCIRQAALAGMFSRICAEPENYDVVNVYHSYIGNTIDFMGYNDKIQCCDRASNWIIKHTSLLLSTFIEDFYKNFSNASLFGIPDYIKVAENICESIPNEFRHAVRRSFIGEKVFRTGLYEMSKQVYMSCQIDLVKIYACFEEVSPEYITMLMESIFDTSGRYFNHHDFITTLRFVSERQSIELLFNIFQFSLSLQQRYYAAELLVHLALLNYVSVAEVQKLLTTVIENPWSQQFLYINDRSKNTFDYKLKVLLMRFLFKESDSAIDDVRNIDMLNVNKGRWIHAAVFGKTK